MPIHFLINGRRYRFEKKYLPKFKKDGKWHKHYGQCDPPKVRDKAITVNTALTEFDELDTIIHEVRHAENWDMYDENYVNLRSTELTRILWRLGYRKIKELSEYEA